MATLEPRRVSVMGARKTAFKSRKKSTFNSSLAEFGITADPNEGNKKVLEQKTSFLSTKGVNKRKSIFSIADFHADKFGCDEKLEAENEVIEKLPFVIHPYSFFRIFLDLTSGRFSYIVILNLLFVNSTI